MSEQPVTNRYRHYSKKLTILLVVLIAVWAVLAYLVVPALWKTYAHRHPALDAMPDITLTGSGIPGDPLNVALIGSKQDLMKIMVAAKWYPADPLSLKSCLEIAEATVLKHPYDQAPVSSLYLFGRKEDLAFEQPVGNNPRERHHVRFWLADKTDALNRPLWIGSAVFDQHVGISRTTGQITHVTAPDVDKERDYLMECLRKTGSLVDESYEDGFHKILEGKNGGGDPWKTDGRLAIGVIKLP
jgi:hypothetical protein